MPLAARLAKLAARIPVVPPPRPADVWFPFPIPDIEVIGDADDLVPLAIAHYQAVVAAARGVKVPPYDPPRLFFPKEPLDVRRLAWRTDERFPAVWEAWRWLKALRVAFGAQPATEPQVSAAEWAELGDWFRRNEERLQGSLTPTGLVDLGGDRRTTLTYLRMFVDGGGRKWHRGRVAIDLRQLRETHGDA